MEETFTPDDYVKLLEEEKQAGSWLYNRRKRKQEKEGVPQKHDLRLIFAYSRALSVRKSVHLGFLEFLLN